MWAVRMACFWTCSRLPGTSAAAWNLVMRCPQECGNGQAGVDVPRRGRQQLRERFYDALAQCRGGSIVPLGNLEADIMFIACPQFVRAVAAKSHSDLFARDAGKQPWSRTAHCNACAAS